MANTAGSGKRREVAKLVRSLRRNGIEIEMGGTHHYRIRNPKNGKIISISFSPSHARYLQEIRAKLRGIGIEL